MNISKEEYKALNELKKDNNRLILTADKGVALVVIDKANYIEKEGEMLNKETYKKIPEDPTGRQKNKLINILKNIKTKGVPQVQGHPNLMGWQRFINQVYPWGP